MKRFLWMVGIVFFALPIHPVASHLIGGDPLFPCASHSCACKSRQKCLTHCCCFPKKNKKIPYGQPLVAACADEERSTGSSPMAVSIPLLPLLGTASIVDCRPFLTDLYQSIVTDIPLPPPRRSV